MLLVIITNGVSSTRGLRAHAYYLTHQTYVTHQTYFFQDEHLLCSDKIWECHKESFDATHQVQLKVQTAFNKENDLLERRFTLRHS